MYISRYICYKTLFYQKFISTNLELIWKSCNPVNMVVYNAHCISNYVTYLYPQHKNMSGGIKFLSLSQFD